MGKPILFAVLATACIAAGADVPVGADGKVDPYILEQVRAEGRADLFVKMAADASLSAAASIRDRAARARFVKDTLETQAARSQAGIRRRLAAAGVAARPFWINNSIFVRGASAALVSELARRADVAHLAGNRGVPLIEPVALYLTAATQGDGVEWNIEQINAPAVWATGNRGEGVVVANIDTGVRYTHEALRAQYRGTLTGSHDYNWWDPDGTLTEPTDANGHGTHTMGTIVGDDGGANQIGVAPGATWIAAQGCDTSLCSPVELISAAQWLLCPTRLDGSDPDCSKAPHLVNNSWGVLVAENLYWPAVRAWVAAGIVPVFAAGNSGPECATLLAPGDYGISLSVGATDRNDVLSFFGSRGPSERAPAGRSWQPDLVAPGSLVRSAYAFSDSVYLPASGTSMAAPHVAGVIALLLASDPSASAGELFAALTRSSVRDLGPPPGSEACGGRAYDEFPNAIYGHGRVDAEGAVNGL